SCHLRGLCQSLRAGRIGGRDARQEKCKIEITSTFVGEIAHLWLKNRLSNLTPVFFDDWRLSRNLNVGRRGREGELECDVKGGPDCKLKRAHLFGKATGDNIDLVLPYRQIRKTKPSLPIRFSGIGLVGCGCECFYTCVRHDGAARI